MRTPPEPPPVVVNSSVPLIVTVLGVLVVPLVRATKTGVDEVKFEKSTVTPAGT